MNNIYLKYMKEQFIKQKKYIICQMIIICIGSMIVAVLPVIHQSIINNVFVKNDFTYFKILLMMMVVLYLFQSSFYVLKDFFQAKIEANIKLQIRTKLNNFIAKKKYLEYLKQGNEQVITRYSNDTDIISRHFSEDVFVLFEQIIIFVLAIFMILRISFILLICMLFFCWYITC